MQKWIGIMASDPSGLIGKDEVLPWHYPEDLAFFRHAVKDQVMLMGSNTYKTLPKSIRQSGLCVVLTRQVKEITYFSGNVILIPDLCFLDQFNFQDKTCYMIGGGVLMNLCLEKDLLSAFILTLMHEIYQGNVFMPIDVIMQWNKTVLMSGQHYDRYQLVK